MGLALAALVALAPPAARAQILESKLAEGKVWRLEGLRTGFCVQLLLDPADLPDPLPAGFRPLRADAVSDLPTALAHLTTNLPEYAAWAPSRFCLYFVQTVDVGSLRIRDDNPLKAPALGVWTVAAQNARGDRWDFALDLYTNHGAVKRAGQVDGLRFRDLKTSVRTWDEEDNASFGGAELSYEIRVRKTTLVWDGRPASDSTRATPEAVHRWVIESRRSREAVGSIAFGAEWTRPMVGVLRVVGRDEVGKAFKNSPIRFVGPAILGGEGEFRFAH